jgi:hypothetical protein
MVDPYRPPHMRILNNMITSSTANSWDQKLDEKLDKKLDEKFEKFVEKLTPMLAQGILEEGPWNVEHIEIHQKEASNLGLFSHPHPLQVLIAINQWIITYGTIFLRCT